MNLDRRGFLGVCAATCLAPLGCGRGDDRFEAVAPRKGRASPVAILDAPGYDARLVDVVLRGLELCSVEVRGRRIVLKPNLVEFDPEGVVNTHPTLLAASVEAFRTLGAREVVVAEGPGHRRDNEYLLRASGLAGVLSELRAPYVDLNVDAVRRVALRSHYTELPDLALPRTVLDADLFVSLPKLKTHHWAGVTLSMKNLFGIVPSSLYGWPKNVLHWQGIQQSILDLNGALPTQRFAIVDAIVGMEGNGPIQGEAKRVGALVFGEDPVAVDATGARLMGIEPLRIAHLREGDRFFGNARRERIEQIGEALERYETDFAVLEPYRFLKEPLG